MQTDGQTDKKNLTVAFRNFTNAPKNRRRSRMCEWQIETSRHLETELKGTRYSF